MDIKVHALWHMPDKILDTGPLWATAMWVYEGIWSKLVDWATNEAAPELTLLRSFCDYEVASFAYWRDPEGFSVPAVTRFTVEYAQEAALRYSVPRDPVQERLITESLGGVRLNKPGHRFDPNIRLALHYYYMDYEPRSVFVACVGGSSSVAACLLCSNCTSGMRSVHLLVHAADTHVKLCVHQQRCSSTQPAPTCTGLLLRSAGLLLTSVLVSAYSCAHTQVLCYV